MKTTCSEPPQSFTAASSASADNRLSRHGAWSPVTNEGGGRGMVGWREGARPVPSTWATCTAWLAGMGATVDRVEPPGRGDFARIARFVDGQGLLAATSLGKRSLDLRAPMGLFSCGGSSVTGRAGRLQAGRAREAGTAPISCWRHPRLVVAPVGFGRTGPWRLRPGHDVNYLGLTG